MHNHILKTVSSIIVLAALLNCGWCGNTDVFHIDYQMALRTIDWLEFINTGADDEAVKEYFMKQVAPTEGCQSIIRHWARFMKWDETEFYNFIMEALERVPTDQPDAKEDGTLTNLGIRKTYWLKALDDPGSLRRDLENLRAVGLEDSALAIAKRFLPEDVILENQFYLVMFGGSSAYSVGDVNGFDLLQLPKNEDGAVDMEETIATFAHELHHSGFYYCDKITHEGVQHDENILLVGILAAEGMPTFYIDQAWNKIERYANGNNITLKAVAADWESHRVRLKELFQEVEIAIGQNLRGQISSTDIRQSWLSGAKGAAYVLGCDMFRIIDKYLGIESAKLVARDYRLLLVTYNRAAQIGIDQGEDLHLFDADLAHQVMSFTGG